MILTTEWFPPECLPVREGDYEVVEKPAHGMPEPEDPEILLAPYCTKYGQTGFWLKLVSGTTISHRLLQVSKWRGMKKIERVALLPDHGQLPLSLPAKPHRVKLLAD